MYSRVVPKWREKTHSCTSICLFSGMSDSEVSPEAELGTTSAGHPQVDCVKEADEAEQTLNKDVDEESIDSGSSADCEDEVMYDIDINADDESAEGRDGGVQRKDEVSGREEACGDTDAACMSGSVDDEGHRIRQQTEAPEQRGESCTESKVMFPLLLGGPALLCSNLCSGGGGLSLVCNVCFPVFIW